MTPDETQQLQTLAVSVLTDIGALTAVTFFHGIFTLLFAISTAIFLRRGLTNRASWTMFAITVVTYAISTIYWAADVAVTVYLLKTPLIDQSDAEIAAKIDLAVFQMNAAGTASLWMSTLPPIISDAVVIWRAWVLFPERRWVMILPISILVGTIASTLTFNVLYTTEKGSAANKGGLFVSSISLSFATNIVTTLIIACKLWSHRKSVVKDLGLSRGRSAVQKVLDVMVESGFAYCTLQAVTVTLDSLPNASESGTPLGYAVQVFLCSYTVLSAMYPTIVIVLVNTQRSFVETYGFSTAWNDANSPLHGHGSRPATVGHLAFAATRPTESTVHSKDTFGAVEKGDAVNVKGEDELYGRHAATAHF